MNRDTAKPYFIRPHVTITHQGILQKELRTCHSPRDILAAFNEVEPKGSLEILNCWRTLRLRRGSIGLGSLHDVRQAWHLWKQVMFLWTSSKGIKYRKVRSPKKKRADYKQVVITKDDSRPATQRATNPQFSDHLSLPVRSQAQEQVSPPVSQPAFQPVSQPVFQPVFQPSYPVQTTPYNGSEDGSEDGSEPDNEISYAVREFLEASKSLQGGKFVFRSMREDRCTPTSTNP